MDSELEKRLVKLIQDNPTWGSNCIVGALANLGYTLSDVTIDNIRRRNGFASAPIRGKNPSCRRFLIAHWETLLAADFFTTEVLSWRGLRTYYSLFVIDLRSRAVHVCGTTLAPNGEWMKAAARPLVDAVTGLALGKTHLIIDRDTKYGKGFRQILPSAGVKIVLCLPRVPQCNAFAERFVRSIKEECLSRLIFLSEQHLQATLWIFTKYHQHRRNHQGIEYQLIAPLERWPTVGRICCQPELGGQVEPLLSRGRMIHQLFRSAGFIGSARRGTLELQPGSYLYVGSAFGPGGPSARIKHHRQIAARRRWHTDYLRAACDLIEVWFSTDTASREHAWAKAVARLQGADVPMPGFGSSDCACETHLFRCAQPPTVRKSRQHVRTSISIGAAPRINLNSFSPPL